MGNIIKRAYQAVMAKIDADLTVDEHSIDCPHQDLGACIDCRNEWTCLGAS